MADDYVVSIQLIDGDGHLVRQQGSQPRDGSLPTSFWVLGETVVDDHVVAITASLRDQALNVNVIVYNQATGRRLMTSAGDSSTLADSVTLFRVKPS